ncbi:MAG TPA: MarC family protein [Candidatus Hydrogenedentes bacterium]|nr:MarC family protein [Candidatus Hydrogenedentota bacterium]
MAASLVSFLAILNPFALCLYLVHLMEDLTSREFVNSLFRATLISFCTFAVFSLAGEKLLIDFLGVQPTALRIFGGLIFLSVGYSYATKGYRASELLRGSLDDVSSAIALPFMIGAGTVTQSILLGKKHGTNAVAIIAMALIVTLAIVLLFKYTKDQLQKTRENVFERYVNILARMNGLVIGAISIEMILRGTREMLIIPQP